MTGNSSLRLTGVYMLSGQLFAVLLGLAVSTPTPEFWLWQGALACLCIATILVFNLKYWLHRQRHESPLWVTDFLTWVRTSTEKEVDQQVEAIRCSRKADDTAPLAIDMRTTYEGRRFTMTKNYNNGISVGLGFFSGERKLRRGDYLVLKQGPFIIIDTVNSKNPSGIFLAYVVKVPDLKREHLI
jgi:hypothetical protein